MSEKTDPNAETFSNFNEALLDHFLRNMVLDLGMPKAMTREFDAAKYRAGTDILRSEGLDDMAEFVLRCIAREENRLRDRERTISRILGSMETMGKVPKGKFRCENCGEIFDQNNDEKANAEAEDVAKALGVDLSKASLFCFACLTMKTWVSNPP